MILNLTRRIVNVFTVLFIKSVIGNWFINDLNFLCKVMNLGMKILNCPSFAGFSTKITSRAFTGVNWKWAKVPAWKLCPCLIFRRDLISLFPNEPRPSRAGLASKSPKFLVAKKQHEPWAQIWWGSGHRLEEELLGIQLELTRSCWSSRPMRARLVAARPIRALDCWPG